MSVGLTVITVSLAFYLTVGSAWGAHTSLSGETYTHKVVLSEHVYEVFWKYDSEKIVFEVEVATTGWVGLGLSPNGGMAGADIVIGGVNSDGSTYFQDYHATANGKPSIDKQQDYELLHASENQTRTSLRFQRKLDTCDDDDRIVNGDTFRLIWAYGNSDDISYHGNSGTRRGSKSAVLLGGVVPEIDMPSNAFTWDFLVENVTVPGKDTVYWCKGYEVPNLPKKHHVLKYEPVVTAGNEALVHHMIIYGCYGDVNVTGLHLHEEERCDYMPNGIQPSCITMLFGWAVGGETFYFPKDVGFPFGDDQQPKFLLLEIHYDNPTLATNLVDSSGMRLTLSPTLRQYDSAMMNLGHAVFPSQAVPPNQESFTTYGYCNSDCTKEGLGMYPDGIKIFAGMLHSHLLGRTMRLRHIRNGVEQEPVFEDNHYDFNYQEMIHRRSEKVILPGDEFQLECGLSSLGKDTFTYGGLATNDEMCLAFVMYYPRANLSTCNNFPWSLAEFWDAKGLQYEYSNKSYSMIIKTAPYTGMHEKTVLENMTWTADNAKLLETSMKKSDYMMFCTNGAEFLKPMGRPYGTYRNGINITHPFKRPARQCRVARPLAGTRPTSIDGNPSYGVSVHAVNMSLLAILVSLNVL